MQATTSNMDAFGPGSRSLADSIVSLRDALTDMRNELADAQSEIIRLTGQLARWRSRCQELPDLNLASIRRDSAFYCHPDRGGSDSLMARLNALFDFLESQELFNGEQGAQI